MPGFVRKVVLLTLVVAVGAIAGLVGAARAEAGSYAIQAPLPAGLTDLSNAAQPAEAEVNDVSCPSADWCVAVGEYDGEAHQIGNGAFIDTLSNGLWTSVSPPSPSDSTATSFTVLLSVSCSAVGSCVAVGEYDGTDRSAGLVETLSDGTWTASTVPLPANGLTNTGATSPLWGVSCTSDGTCVAVGQYETTFFNSHGASYPAGTGLVETLPAGSSTWSATQVLDPNGTMPQGGGSDNGTVLHAVSCSSDTSCTAVGTYGQFDGFSGEALPWIVTLSGGVWSGMEAPVPANAFTTLNGNPNLNAGLFGVSCVSDGFCAAVGQYNVAVSLGSQTGSASVPLVETLPSGGSWTATEATLPSNAAVPDSGLNETMTGVDCLDDGDCDAAGFYFPTGGPFGSFISTLAAGSWSSTAIPAPSDSAGGSESGVYGGISCADQVNEGRASATPASEAPASPTCVFGGEYTAKVVGTTSDKSEGLLTRVTAQAGAIDQAAPTAATVALGNAFSGQLAVTGQYGTVTFTQSTGSAALTVSSSGAVSAPTTLAAGVYTATGSDSDPVGDGGTWSFQLTVGSPVSVTTTSLPNWTVDQPGYDQTIDATGGAGALAFAVSAGALPNGLSLSSGGVVSGTPIASGSFTFTITASDTADDSGSQSFTVTINPAVTISTVSLASGTQNAAYDETVAASGGTGALAFSVGSGTLPTGLTLSSSGVLSGTPTVAGSFSFTVEATDAVGATGSRNYTVTIAAPVSVTTASLPNWTVNQAGYDETVVATGGAGALAFSVSAGTLPTGLSLSSGGVVSGVPTSAGSFTFTVTASDTDGDSGSQEFSVTINPAIAITTVSLARGSQNEAYDETVVATGGTGARGFSVSSGALPVGLTLSSGGVLSGTPTVAGSFSFTVEARDAVGATASRSYTLTIGAVITITTVSLPNWTVDRAGYHAQLAAVGGTSTLRFSKTSGALPTGLTLSSSGVLSGVPTSAGSFTFTVTASDTAGDASSDSYTVTVNPAIAITTASLASGTPNEAYDDTVVAAGGTGALSFSVGSGTLPVGLTLSSVGVVSGTPTASGSFTFTVTASDTVGATGTQSYTILILPPFAPVVEGFSPGQGHVGDSVTISGVHFTGATAVTFDGTPATTFTVVSDASIVAVVPAGATTGHVSVTNPNGTLTSAGTFTVLPAIAPPPTITSFTPPTGVLGARVIIRGSGFTGATMVTFNGIRAGFVVVNDSTIFATVPFGSATGAIAVTTPGGTAVSATGFTG